MRRNFKGILALTVLAVFGFSAIAFAGWGGGYGQMMGPGWRHNGGYYGGPSGEGLERLNEQRAQFYKETENLRQELYEKQMDLRSELAKEDPDTGKASRLQGEISQLKGELDQKRLEYDIEARKSGRGYGYNRGFGGHGPMMGYGPRGGGGYGPGYCWR